MTDPEQAKTAKEIGNDMQNWKLWIPVEVAEAEISRAKDEQFIQDGKFFAFKIQKLEADLKQAKEEAWKFKKKYLATMPKITKVIERGMLKTIGKLEEENQKLKEHPQILIRDIDELHCPKCESGLETKLHGWRKPYIDLMYCINRECLSEFWVIDCTAEKELATAKQDLQNCKQDRKELVGIGEKLEGQIGEANQDAESWKKYWQDEVAKNDKALKILNELDFYCLCRLRSKDVLKGILERLRVVLQQENGKENTKE